MIILSLDHEIRVIQIPMRNITREKECKKIKCLMLFKYFKNNILNGGSRGFELILLKDAKFCFDLINSNQNEAQLSLWVFFFFLEKMKI